jgi:hypothetical protein
MVTIEQARAAVLALPDTCIPDKQQTRQTIASARKQPAHGRALRVAAVTDRCYDRHSNAEFLDFVKLVAKTYPRRRLHVVLDNYDTHEHDDINQWHPRITLHFTPISGSWLNLVEVFFGIITRQGIRRGFLTSATRQPTSDARHQP